MSESDYPEGCSICGKKLDDDYHAGHELDCPNFGHEDDDEWEQVNCVCSLVYHPECCPVCKLLDNHDNKNNEEFNRGYRAAIYGDEISHIENPINRKGDLTQFQIGWICGKYNSDLEREID